MLAPGQKVRVKLDWPETRGPCHIRTPHYLRGELGMVVRHLGNRPLYHIAFDLAGVWHEGESGDEILVELYEHWLEPA